MGSIPYTRPKPTLRASFHFLAEAQAPIHDGISWYEISSGRRITAFRGGGDDGLYEEEEGAVVAAVVESSLSSHVSSSALSLSLSLSVTVTAETAT